MKQAHNLQGGGGGGPPLTQKQYLLYLWVLPSFLEKPPPSSWSTLPLILGEVPQPLKIIHTFSISFKFIYS